ncbi:MAG: HutD family protein [Actinomycetia bacterium]|nr:HutD family protein [Actinomycetes bacterium]
MTQLIRAEDVALQPWRNGGGQTRELLAWPSAEQCNLRIALADIATDGPFSAYDGVERWIVVISGVGIKLTFSDGERELTRRDEPLRFDGADAPDCRLLDGPTRDLNLMVQGGRGAMRPVQSGVAWTETFAMRGVFTVAPGRKRGGSETCDVQAMTLLWSDVADDFAWTFEHDQPQSLTQAWWLGFTPAT